MKTNIKGILTSALLLTATALAAAPQNYTLRNDKLQVTVDEKGCLSSIRNLQTGRDYAGGDHLWRLYYDTHHAKEIEVLPADQTPRISHKSNTITLSYDKLKAVDFSLAEEVDMNMGLQLEIILEDDQVRFVSKIENRQPGTIIRELHYPLVGNIQLPKDHKLLLTHTGGQLYDDPRVIIFRNSNAAPYRTPAQKFRQMDANYPMRTVTGGTGGCMASNCFAYVGEAEGLYFGSHDTTYQNTGHGLRLYPDSKGEFTRLESGFYKFPQCFAGQTWTCDANVVAPYTGTWHETSKLYRRWADTWWDHRGAPMWVRMMRSWQRIIFRHQYGDLLFKYTDLPGRIKRVGESVGAEAVFAFGWWEKGMDHGNPHYDADPAQGGDEGWKKAIAEFKKDGGKLLLYFNGKLIDRESEFYKSGKGKEICFRDNTGAELTEQYRFTGQGTFLADYNARTFAIADTRAEIWRKMLLEWADRAREYGANSVFYDQLGYGERATNWDTSGEFPVPNLRVIADKAEALKLVRDRNVSFDPEFALGTEWLTDVTAQYCDYIHIYQVTAGKYSFIDWFRYTFPEIIISDREIRDDTDIERRVNNTLLKGLRNDIEIYRCRDLIDKTPHYQAYLTEVNAIKGRYGDLLLAGTYRDTEGFSLTTAGIEARAYTNGNGMAIVATRTQEGAAVKGMIEVPGYRFVESSTLGNARVSSGGREVTLGQYDLAVLVYEKVK
ncbi:DUF6259 domain-containing protein [uncultured Alistipes sp.]|uniref:DUF6259 domain-containing protein n=1 Tax=uncultured Alistipes sp. TaxID=538949 RepID=UPI0025F7D104|nr:DUF6259 domain-containing protein [uncultured Alistipes sp.]